MPKITLEIVPEQIMDIIRELSVKDKIELTRMFEQEIFADRFHNLLNNFGKSAQVVPLTINEIADEVEAVRRARYEGCH